MKVVFTPEAEHGLQAIGDYIAQDSPVRAMSFIEELRAQAIGLADFPEAFPLVPRYADRGVRRRPHGRYLILYRPAGEFVVILRVLHGALDEANWLDEGV